MHNPEKKSVATKTLAFALKQSPEMKQAYKDNIAGCIMDAMNQNPDKSLAEKANIAAENFLTLIIRS